jgi:hypothetical protein
MDIVEDKEAKMLFAAIVVGGMKIAKSEIEVYSLKNEFKKVQVFKMSDIAKMIQEWHAGSKNISDSKLEIDKLHFKEGELTIKLSNGSLIFIEVKYEEVK